MLLNREELTRRRDQLLAPYAVHESHCRGRLHPESESSYRTPFQKDRDRIIHTAAFRRLEYKTQVFFNAEGDYYRTRLTHTLEVAQVARSLATALGANETLVETLALAHDLGHPPFGHAGEDTLDALMSSSCSGGFDHNHQTFRIVTELERRYPHFDGLNLTLETLEGIVKHDLEATVYPSFAQAFSPEKRPSLEAQIAGIADDTAYNVHDLDDGLKSEILTPLQLKELRIWNALDCPTSSENLGEMDRRVLIRQLLGSAVTDILSETAKRLSSLNMETSENIQRAPVSMVSHSPEMGKMMLELKMYLREHLYAHPSKIRQAHRAEHFVQGLFDAYIRRPRLLPINVQSHFETLGLERTICDYIAGMTDRFAVDEFRRLYAPVER